MKRAFRVFNGSEECAGNDFRKAENKDVKRFFEIHLFPNIELEVSGKTKNEAHKRVGVFVIIQRVDKDEKRLRVSPGCSQDGGDGLGGFKN